MLAVNTNCFEFLFLCLQVGSCACDKVILCKGFTPEAGLRILELMLQRGANANAAGLDGIPLLHLAVMKRMPEIVQLLLLHGADISSRHISARGDLNALGLAQ